MAKVSPRWVEDKEEGDKPRRCVSPWVPSVTVETLAFTLTGAIIIIIIMSPVLRFNHQVKNNPSDWIQEHQEYAAAGGRHNVAPLTSRARGRRCSSITGAGARRRRMTSTFVRELEGSSGEAASLLAAFLQEREGLDLGCALHVSAARRRRPGRGVSRVLVSRGR